MFGCGLIKQWLPRKVNYQTSQQCKEPSSDSGILRGLFNEGTSDTHPQALNPHPVPRAGGSGTHLVLEGEVGAPLEEQIHDVGLAHVGRSVQGRVIVLGVGPISF